MDFILLAHLKKEDYNIVVAYSTCLWRTNDVWAHGQSVALLTRDWEGLERRAGGMFGIGVTYFFSIWHLQPLRVWASSFLRLHDHTQGHTTVGRTPLDEWSTCLRDLHVTTHNTYKRQTSIPPAGFEPTIPVGDRPQTHALVLHIKPI
jgi:hypothetical protein